MLKWLVSFCVLSLVLSTGAFGQNVSFQWQTDDRRHSDKPIRFSRTQDVESAFEQCRGSKDFFHGRLETALQPDELLVEITLPAWPRGAGWSILEFSRRHGDFALAGVASMISLSLDGACSDVRMTAFGAGPRPIRLTLAETELRGNPPDKDRIREAARRPAKEVSPMDDNHASAAYRRHLVETLVARSIVEAMTRAEQH
jgi:aerobic carbon-monoxide dehydrogenase medium subunit